MEHQLAVIVLSEDIRQEHFLEHQLALLVLLVDLLITKALLFAQDTVFQEHSASLLVVRLEMPLVNHVNQENSVSKELQLVVTVLLEDLTLNSTPHLVFLVLKRVVSVPFLEHLHVLHVILGKYLCQLHVVIVSQDDSQQTETKPFVICVSLVNSPPPQEHLDAKLVLLVHHGRVPALVAHVVLGDMVIPIFNVKIVQLQLTLPSTAKVHVLNVLNLITSSCVIRKEAHLSL
jgi:hypothetical protein